MIDENSTTNGRQMSIDFESPADKLPNQDNFPLNIKSHGRSTKSTLLNDINRSSDCQIITGFTSLSQIIDVFGNDQLFSKKVRILLGFEPQIKVRKKWKTVQIDQEIQDYWLDRGISPFKCGAVLKTIELIKSGHLEFKALDKLHAKLYITETTAILGSSNFSQSGLVVQHEANIRVTNQDAANFFQYKSIQAIGEYYYSKGHTYSEKMIALLEELLIIVDWQEALARAIAELLESAYVKEYLKAFELPGVPKLWPSQASGINQGLQILQELGSLLVADPTGSGKTKMLSTLQIAMVNWLWITGRGSKTNTVVVAPPLVVDNWKTEQLKLQKVLSDPISQGILSMPKSYKNKLAKDTLKISNLLVMDEAHNYLNQFSERSVSISAHGAEFIILSTATPINKKAEDLLRLIQLLDPDNLADEELQEFKTLFSNPAKSLEENPEISRKLKSYIWKFTLRRTKEDLNKLIGKEPEKYLNALGQRCRYPKQQNNTYPTGETKNDIAIAKKIEELAEGLKGLIYLKKINFPKGRILDTLEKRSAYIQGRLNMAKSLSRYRVQATLRSSRIALVELVEGTKQAELWAGLGSINKETGNISQKLLDMKTEIPIYSSKWDVLPEWLTEKSLFELVCDEEITIYKNISELARSMSDTREQSKAKELIRIMNKHSLVVSFDHTIITLHYLENIIKKKGIACYIASGSTPTSKHLVLEDFSLGSSSKNIIALCSDAVAEGVNLQAASAVVMLDMPSVLRLAEQRIGRIDRLDSPHSEIYTYWPNDSPQFALRADRNLIRTSQLTKYLMGSNIRLPDEFIHRYEDLKPMTANEVIEELKATRQEEEKEWEGIKDAFGDVHALVEGTDPLLSEDEYKQLINSRASVRCKLSFVESKQGWCFIALRGKKERVSRWLFITEDGSMETDFSIICLLLRKNLVSVVKHPYVKEDLDRFIEIFRNKERDSLPHKKRRALNTAQHILQSQLKLLKKHPDHKLSELIKEVLELFKITTEEVSIDFQSFAVLWLDLLSPRLKTLREKQTKRRFWSLDDLKSRYQHFQFSTKELEYILQHVPLTEPFDLQIAACIIGVKNKEA